jgi:predicted amidohydrolase YtcJ
MTPDETLKGFTAGAAFAMFAEERLGILRPGMNMDMTIIDRDLFKASPREVLEAKVLMTIIEGEAVYEAR